MAVIEKRVSKAGTVSFRAKVRLTGFPPQTATFERKTDAKDWSQRVEAEIKDGRYFPNAQAKKKTANDLIEQYLLWLKSNNIRRYNEVLPKLMWWKKEIGERILSQLRGEIFFNAQQKLCARLTRRKGKDGQLIPFSNGTVNRYTGAMNTALNFGVETLEWIARNPMDKVDGLKEPQGRDRSLSDDEKARLLNACRTSESPNLFYVVLLAISTGARKGEILKIRWADVNLKSGRVALRDTKNEETRAMHAKGVALEVLRRLYKSKADDQVLVFPNKNDADQPAEIKTAWYTAVERAGLVDFHFHDLRHSCASYLAMNGASLAELAEVLGHKSLQMVKRYAHLTETHTSKVVERMNKKVLGNVRL